MVVGAIDEGAAEILEDVEDPLAQIGFQIGLRPERLLADVVEKASAIPVPFKGGGTEEGEEELEIARGADLAIVDQVEYEAGIHGGLLGVEAPLVAVGQDGPGEEAASGVVAGVVQVVLDLLAGKPAGRLPAGHPVEGMQPFLGFPSDL